VLGNAVSRAIDPGQGIQRCAPDGENFACALMVWVLCFRLFLEVLDAR
jgi:hypothetical protein